MAGRLKSVQTQCYNALTTTSYFSQDPVFAAARRAYLMSEYQAARRQSGRPASRYTRHRVVSGGLPTLGRRH